MRFIAKMFRARNAETRSERPGPGVRPAVVREGFTLVELLVTMTIMVIVGIAALTTFKTTAEHEVRQQENLEHIQNLRVAFNTVTRDVRMAGNGLAVLGTPLIQVYVAGSVYDRDTQESEGWFRYKGAQHYGARAIFGTDSGADMTKADTLTIFRADVEAVNPIGRLQSSYAPGGSATTLTLQTAVTEGVDLSDGDIIALSTGAMSLILEARIDEGVTTADLKIGTRFMPAEALHSSLGSDDFPSGTAVYNLKNVTFVTYYLDAANLKLMANYHDQATIKNSGGSDTYTPNIAVVAENIEDFQVNYYLSPSPDTDPIPNPSINENQLTPAATTWINAVKIGMVSRSASSRNQGKGEPVELMGHSSSNAYGYARRMLVENVQLRNY